MKYYIKLFIIYWLRIILKCFYIFPIKNNRIIFSSYEGLSYTCNPKYIFQYFHKHSRHKFQYIWCLNDKSKLPLEYSDDVIVVKFLSIQHIYYLLTSKVIISNLGIEPFIPKRKKQFFINTWHGGGAYKRVSSDLAVFSQAQTYYVRKLREIRRRETNIFLSGSKAFTKVASNDFHINLDAFVNTGMPRNDVLINPDNDAILLIRQKIATSYHCPTDSLWVLYAPTFRGTYRNQQHIDNQIIAPEITKAFEEKFGKKVTILNRAHISRDNKNMNSSDECFDVSLYPDMQDLLLSCDILITDYSSSVWDFSLTNKPCFLFVPDLEAYEKSIGFYTPIEKWAFPYAKSITELCDLINAYNYHKAQEKIHCHQVLLGSYEKGNACKEVYELILNLIHK